jgi:hypothetical protein
MMLDLDVTVSAKLGEHKLSANLASSQREVIAGALDIAHQVWMDNVKGTEWSSRTWTDRKRNLAACIEGGLHRSGVELSYDEILAVLGETVSGSTDFLARTLMKHLFIGVKEFNHRVYD